MPWRALRRSPAFTLAAVFLLAIGMGGTAVVFTVTDSLLLQPLAIPRPGELARVVELISGRPPALYLEWAEFEEFSARTRSFAAVFAHSELSLTLEGGASERPIRAGIVSPTYFDVMEIRPAVGHLPRRDDEAAISYRFWQSEFHGDPAAAGRVLRLNRYPFTIAGVLPRDFNGLSVESGPPVHLLSAAARLLFPKGDPGTCCQWEVAGRLRPGVTPAAASPEAADSMHAAILTVAGRAKPLSGEVKGNIARQNFQVESLERGISRLRDRFGSGLLALFTGAVLLLLLACANIAGMMVARAAAREREMALRAALGATRGRLMRLWLAESSTLALLGGAAGLLLARLALPLVAGTMPPLRDLGTYLVPVALDLRLNWRVFAFAFGLCTLAALLAGIAPAWHSSRASLSASLKAAAADPRRARLRSALTVMQVAICTVVLANSALLVATLRALRATPAGFDRDRIVTFNVDTPTPGDLGLRLEREAARLPGVDRTALASRSLMRGSGFKTAVGLPGTRNARDLNSSINQVSPAYFDTMGIRIVAGRALAPGDGGPREPHPVVVNQAFVRRFFPNTDPLGRTFGVGFDHLLKPELEIVGVVTDTRYRSLREPFQPIFYRCFCDEDARLNTNFALEVRTVARPETVIASVRSLMHSLAPGVPFREVRTLAQDVDDSLWAERTLAAIGMAFAAVATVVASIGLYGLLSYTLAQRRREIGIRIALGAGRREIARAVVVRVLALVGAGAIAGSVLALWTGRMLTVVLWQVVPTDPRIHLAAWSVLLFTAIIAAALPAWRATRTDPAQALREN